MTRDAFSIMSGLRLPLICAPMFGVSNAALVGEARRSGIVGALPRQNFATRDEFEAVLQAVHETDGVHPGGKVAVNLSTALSQSELRDELALLGDYGVRVVITAKGSPAPVIEEAHRRGISVFSDVTSLEHARKARNVGADGLICICQGGGGHSGRLNHMSMLGAVRDEFDGVIVLAGALSTGADILAAQALGADLAYMGTRFIATVEAGSPPAYKEMLVQSTANDLVYTPMVNKVPANWLRPSLAAAGIDETAMPAEGTRLARKPWIEIWSAGQGIETINDIPSVGALVDRLETQYRHALATLQGKAGVVVGAPASESTA